MRHPFELQSFVDWLGKQPPDEEYNYYDEAECALGRYAQWLGMEPAAFYMAVGRTLDPLPFNPIGKVVAYLPWTYGAATQRAKELLGQ